MIAYLVHKISAKNYQNLLMCVKVITRQSSDIFETQCISSFIADTQLIIKTDGTISNA